MEDFISELPEVLIHQIMSFLPYRDAVRTGVLSPSLYSALQSLPILEFDIDNNYRGIRMSSETFLQLVYDSIENQSTECLKRLRIRAVFNQKVSALALNTISLAESRKLQELELENCDNMRFVLDNLRFFMALPINDLLFESLTVLKIEGFRFESGDVTLGRSSRLKKLSICRCIGFNALVLEKNPSLEVLEIFCCKELSNVIIDAPNLESFEFQTPSWLHLQCEITILPGSNSLRNLKLKHLGLAESLLQLREAIPRMQMILMETNSRNRLKLNCFHMVWDNLKILELEGIEVSNNLEISSQYLQSCVLDMKRSSTRNIRFNFSQFRFLKVLTISSSEAITGDWIETHLFEFHFLKHLTLHYCNKLEWIRFEHQEIESLKLIKCNALTLVQIDAPLLDKLEMKLKGKIPSQVVILSRALHVKLSLNLRLLQPVPYEDLKNFLVSFDNCRELTLDFSSNYVSRNMIFLQFFFFQFSDLMNYLLSAFDKDLIFPSKEREEMTSPLHDLKHLKVELGLEQHDFSRLLSGLLWIVPLPECITFIQPDSETDQSIKFKYVDFEGEEEDRVSCCSYCQCWRHSLRSIQLNNFKHSDKRNIVNFFKRNALRLEAIHDDS